ncbi:hypothetical protein ACRAWD_26360 [Caulobacter segnis]
MGYAFASFWPTGEMRTHDAAAGEFKRPKILEPGRGRRHGRRRTGRALRLRRPDRRL